LTFLRSGNYGGNNQPASDEELPVGETIHVAAAHGPAGPPLRFSDLTLDPRTREVKRGTRRIELTPIEFALLELLLENAETVLARSLIFERVWGFDLRATSNSLNVYVGYLRRKTEAEGEPRLIHTVRGIGYVLRNG
jgi:two-component system response regulator MprA